MRYRAVLVAAATVAGALASVPGPAGASGPSAQSTRVASFRVGAAVTDITPPLFGAVANDPANCLSKVPNPAAYSGPRLFAFEEPYIDQSNSGFYQPGDPFIDCNGNGRWDGILLGGGGNTPRFPTKVADPITARAFVVSNGRSNLAVEVLDNEGVFNVYQQRIRDSVAADGTHLAGVFISATHDESAPDLIGISGVDQLTSGVDAYYADYMVSQAAKAIEAAKNSMRPAVIRYAQGVEPADLQQCWSSYPFVDNQLMPVLQAVGTDGRVIATLSDVSQHAETLGFSPSPVQTDWISADWPHYFRNALESRYGGVAIEMAGSVGSSETPLQYPATVSRVPQQFLSEPNSTGGCRTLFQPSGMAIPTGYDQATQALGLDLAGAVSDAVDSSATWSHTDALWGERSPICVPLTNQLFQLGAGLGVFAERPGYTNGCTVEIPPGPNGAAGGNEALSSVAAFRIGDGEFVSVPGEVFPFTYLRSFLGPQDMPNSQFSLPAWLMPHMHAPYRFINGLADDMLGYIFPQGNGVGVPGENNNGSGVDKFGCGHSDDSEAASSQTGSIVGDALVSLLDAKGGHPEAVVSGRYVLADGTLTRDPQGQPASIKCNMDTIFSPGLPAVGVWVPGGRGGYFVSVATWMSLSGTAQSSPDRNTRGWIGKTGSRHWLDVYGDIAGAPGSIKLPKQRQ